MCTICNGDDLKFMISMNSHVDHKLHYWSHTHCKLYVFICTIFFEYELVFVTNMIQFIHVVYNTCMNCIMFARNVMLCVIPAANCTF